MEEGKELIYVQRKQTWINNAVRINEMLKTGFCGTNAVEPNVELTVCYEV